jgi:membrane protease YdiL (CAAX protease family)
MDAQARRTSPDHRVERRAAIVACLYAVLLVPYLFLHPEPEAWHWLTLVAVPLTGVVVVAQRRSVRTLLASLGLEAAAFGRGWWLTGVLAGLFQILQLLNVRQREAVAALLGEPSGWLVVPAAAALLLLTAATTEEVFFRGVLQATVARATARPVLALIVSLVAFIAYHVPYAYLRPGWGANGDLSDAVGLAITNGLLGGLPLGIVYWRSGNLWCAITLHAAIDLIPAMRLVGAMWAA